MALDDFKGWGEANRDRPDAHGDNDNVPLHATHRGELVTAPLWGNRTHQLAGWWER